MNSRHLLLRLRYVYGLKHGLVLVLSIIFLLFLISYVIRILMLCKSVKSLDISASQGPKQSAVYRIVQHWILWEILTHVLVKCRTNGQASRTGTLIDKAIVWSFKLTKELNDYLLRVERYEGSVGTFCKGACLSSSLALESPFCDYFTLLSTIN